MNINLTKTINKRKEYRLLIRNMRKQKEENNGKIDTKKANTNK